MSRLLVLFILSIGFIPSAFCFSAPPEGWVRRATCGIVPVISGEAAQVISEDQVEIRVESASGSVMAIENGFCTMVYFKNALNGRKEADLLGCLNWLNYDVPTFNDSAFNFPTVLTTGRGGEWGRAIWYDQGKYSLRTLFTVAADDPDQNRYLSNTQLISCR